MPIPLFDAHCDTVYERVLKKRGGDALGTDHISVPMLAEFAPAAQFFAMFEGVHGENVTFDEMFSSFREMLAEYPESISLCRGAADAECAFQAGRTAAFLSVEGCGLLGCTEEGLEKAYKEGVRAVMPVWNYANDLCGTNIEHPDQGLTEQGRKFVKKAMELGIVVDVSHMSDAGFYDVYEMSVGAGRPFMASHSNSRMLCGHPRNLTDDMFLKICETGGVVGINMYTKFITEDGECTLDSVISHIERFISLGGAKNVILGCDLDGCETLPAGMRNVLDLKRLYDRMTERGFDEKLVRGIFFDNMMEFIRRALP